MVIFASLVSYLEKCNHAYFLALRPLQMTLIEFSEFILFDVVLLNKSFASKRGFCLHLAEFHSFFLLMLTLLKMTLLLSSFLHPPQDFGIFGRIFIYLFIFKSNIVFCVYRLSHLLMYVLIDIKKQSTLEKQVVVQWQVRTIRARNYGITKNNLCGSKEGTRCESLNKLTLLTDSSDLYCSTSKMPRYE